MSEDDDPTSALDFRLNCAFASISIFNDYDVLRQTQTSIQQNEFSRFFREGFNSKLDSINQFIQEEMQNLNKFGHFKDKKQGHQVGF